MACCYDILVCRISICCNRNYYRGGFIMNQLNQFSYKNVLVLGLAKSGLATADVLLNININIIVNDLSTNRDDPLVKKLEDKGVRVILRSHPIESLHNIELIVTNPGITYKSNSLNEAI